MDGSPEMSPSRAPAAKRPGSNGARSAIRIIWIDLLLYPTHSLPTAAAPVLVGLGLASRDGVLAALPALVGFLGSWFIHVAGVFADNHELLRRHPGLGEHPELDRAIEDGTLALWMVKAAIAGWLVLALATAPWLWRIGGAPVLAAGAVGVAVSLSYNAGLAYVRRGVADPIFFVMFGVVGVALTYYIQAAAVRGAPAPWALLASLPARVWLAGLPAGALVTAVMLIDDLRDREFDRAKGWRTGAVVLGPRFSRAEITALVAFAYVAPLALALALGPWVLLPLASAPLAWRTVRALRTAARREDLVPLTPRMAALATIHSALLGLGLALAR
jgi:1,4-dihydroxy-2-naphthoate octaprenyltransferase